MRKVVRYARRIIWRLTKLAEYFTNDDYRRASEWERYVANRIVKLSDYRFNVKFTGFGAGNSTKFKDTRTEAEQAKAELDLLVRLNDEPLAIIEVTTGNKRTWEQSKFFPIASHKTKRTRKQLLPAYIVYVLTKEIPAMEFWLRLETVATFEPVDMTVYIHGNSTIINNHAVPKGEWNRGLQSLVKELG